jgi:hypothetical protein
MPIKNRIIKLIKVICEKPTANITFSGKIVYGFSLRSDEKQTIPALLFNILWAILHSGKKENSHH